MFYDESKGIMVKVFGEMPVDITYRYFLDVVHSLFDEYDAGAHTWEKCFGVLPGEGTTAQKQKEPVEPKMPEYSGEITGKVQEDISAEKVIEKPEIARRNRKNRSPDRTVSISIRNICRNRCKDQISRKRNQKILHRRSIKKNRSPTQYRKTMKLFRKKQ